MPLIAFVSKKNSKKIVYAFDTEMERHPDESEYVALPPDPVVVQSTATFMADFPLLDSFSTLDDLDHQMNIEAAEERETREYQSQIIDQ